jgi:hypothetical protein
MNIRRHPSPQFAFFAVLAATLAAGPSPAAPKNTVIAVRESRINLSRNAVVAFPLYDGKITEVGSGLRDIGVVRMGAQRAVSIAGHVARSRRAEIFRVVGVPGETGVVTVLLRLPDMTEHCVSCRVVRYFYTIR